MENENKDLINIQFEDWLVIDFNELNSNTLINNCLVANYQIAENKVIDYAIFLEGELVGLIEQKKINQKTYSAFQQIEMYGQKLDSENKLALLFVLSTVPEFEVIYKDVRIKNFEINGLIDFPSPDEIQELYYKPTIDRLNKIIIDSSGTLPILEIHNIVYFILYLSFLNEKFLLFANNILKSRNITYDTLENQALIKEVEIKAKTELFYFLKPEELIVNITKSTVTLKSIFEITDLFCRVLKNIDQNLKTNFASLFDNKIKTFFSNNLKGYHSIWLLNLIDEISSKNFWLSPNNILVELRVCFDYLLKSASKSMGGEAATPPTLNKLLGKLVSCHDNNVTSIYDPACGLGDSLLFTLKEQKTMPLIFGQESKSSAYHLCIMNLIMHGQSLACKNIINDDIISNPAYLNKTFDAAISCPPFNIKINRNQHAYFENIFNEQGIPSIVSDSHYVFLFHMLHQLKETGILICILPLSVLFRSSKGRQIRKFLIDELNVIETVINLPANLLNNTSLPVCVLILKKNRKKNDGILFVDANNKSVKRIDKNILRKNDIHNIVNVFKNKITKENYSNIVSKEDVRDNDYDLSVARYVDSYFNKLTQKHKNSELKKIGSLVEFVKPLSLTENLKSKALHIGTLSADLEQLSLIVEEMTLIEKSKLKPGIAKIYQLQKGDVIIQYMNNLKTSIYMKEISNHIFLKGGMNIFVMRPKNKEDSEYLYFALNSESIKKQLQILAIGSVQPFLNKERVEKLLLPNIKSNRKKAFLENEKLEILSKEKARMALITNELNLKKDQQDNEFQLIGALCHDLKPKLSKIRRNTISLKNYLTVKGLLNETTIEPLDEEDKPKNNAIILKENDDSINNIINLLENIRSIIIADKPNDYICEVDIVHYFKNEFKAYESDNVFIDIKSNKSKIKLSIYNTVFKEAFDNLIRNAILHGRDNNSIKLNIAIEITDEGEHSEFVQIDFANNGIRFPEELDEAAFFKYGKKGKNSKGHGLGGAFIKKVLDWHGNAEFRIIKDSIYGAHFQIKFKKRNSDE